MTTKSQSLASWRNIISSIARVAGMGSNFLTESPFHRCDSMSEYFSLSANIGAEAKSVEDQITEKQSKQSILSHCVYCDSQAKVLVDFLYSAGREDGKRMPNFRERMVCPRCGLNNRLRATYHLMKELLGDLEKRKIYITEETTPFFLKLKKINKKIIGSEYFADDARKKVFMKDLGRELNNENLCKLSFGKDEFDLVVSCDVLEHIPDYKKALQEIFRVLKEDGQLIFSVPFLPNEEKTVVRAICEDGKISHLLQPEYHGDPVNPQGGCLCFYHFGWDLLEEIKKIGFRESGVYIYQSLKYGYLGRGILLYAKK